MFSLNPNLKGKYKLIVRNSNRVFLLLVANEYNVFVVVVVFCIVEVACINTEISIINISPHE